MRKFIAILFVFVGVLAFEQLDSSTASVAVPTNEVKERRVELSANYTPNRELEAPFSVEVPSVQIRVINGHRTQIYRAPQISASGHYHTVSNYAVARYILRLSSYTRAVDFYLYTLCQLRL